MRNLRKLAQKGVSMIEYAILLGLICGLAVGFMKGDGMIGSINGIVRNVQMVFDDELKASEARKNFVVDDLPGIIKQLGLVQTKIEDCTYLQSTYDGETNAAKKAFDEYMNKNGMNLGDDYNIQYYGYSRDWQVFRWSTVDITTLKPGDYIPVIQYSDKTKKFEYYNFKVEQDKNGKLITNKTWSEPGGQKQGLTYEQAEKYYYDAVANLQANQKTKPAGN